MIEYWQDDSGMLESYGAWAANALHGDLGYSTLFHAPVVDVIQAKFLNSILVLATAWTLSGILGFVLGIIAGYNKGKLIDKLIKGYCFILASSPSFWIALLVLMVFAVQLGCFPIGFSSPINTSAQDAAIQQILYHAILPALTLSIVGVANIALHTREKTIDVMNSKYIMFAQTRGMGRKRALLKIGLRNLSLPAISPQFASIAEIISGAVLIEQVFSYPGLGQATIGAAFGGDYNLLVGIAVFTAVIVFVGNVLANIISSKVDPRIDARQSW